VLGVYGEGVLSEDGRMAKEEVEGVFEEGVCLMLQYIGKSVKYNYVRTQC
jgi:hypothetical protein